MRWHPSPRTAPSDYFKNQVSPALSPQGAVHLSDHLSWPGSGLAPTPPDVAQSWHPTLLPDRAGREGLGLTRRPPLLMSPHPPQETALSATM